MKYVFSGDFMQHIMVVSCRRFGTTYRSYLQGSSIPRRSVKSCILHKCWLSFCRMLHFHDKDTGQMFTMRLWSGKC